MFACACAIETPLFKRAMQPRKLFPRCAVIGCDLVATEREIETFRHHPDDLVTVAIQGDGLADDGLITGELRLPHWVAQDDSAIPRLLFVRSEGPAEQRFDSEQVEQFAGNSFA